MQCAPNRSLNRLAIVLFPEQGSPSIAINDGANRVTCSIAASTVRWLRMALFTNEPPAPVLTEPARREPVNEPHNDRVERPATMTVPRPGAAHDPSRYAR